MQLTKSNFFWLHMGVQLDNGVTPPPIPAVVYILVVYDIKTPF